MWLSSMQKEFKISTHTSLAGRDGCKKTNHNFSEISTHTSLAGRDQLHKLVFAGQHSFLLTRPSRDVTSRYLFRNAIPAISTHTSLAGRDQCPWGTDKCPRGISTHTSLAGRDDENRVTFFISQDFYSHVPRGT